MKKAFAEENFKSFTDSAENINEVCLQRPIDELYEMYLSWGTKNRQKTICQANFNMRMREVIAGARLNASSQNANKLVKNARITLAMQFNHLESMINIMTRGVVNSLFVYGEPGIGKSEIVERTLKDTQANYIVYSGGVKGTAELAKILYDNRDGKIIVFDDFDSVFAKKAQIDILKIALQDKTKRTISWVDGTRRAKANRIPERFDFTSSVVFISNRRRLDPAIKDRCAIVSFESTKEENLDWIKAHFHTFLPQLPGEMKNMVYDFIKKNISKFDRVNFRVFRFAIINYIAHPEDDSWKNITINGNAF